MTDLACPVCLGTGEHDECWHDVSVFEPCPYDHPCPECDGLGVAAWAVEAAANGLPEVFLEQQPDNRVDGIPNVLGPGSATNRRIAVAVLAAVREEAKNQ